MAKQKHAILQSFRTSDLIFDEEETKEILKFFFKNDVDFIDKLDINDELRSFSQAILVEAVDASYAIGYVKIIFDTFFLKPPSPKIKKVFIKLGKKAAIHWFKHAKANDLTKIKIYESVRSSITRTFRYHFMNIANGLAMSKPIVGVIAYSTNSNLNIIWC